MIDIDKAAFELALISVSKDIGYENPPRERVLREAAESFYNAYNTIRDELQKQIELDRPID